MNLRLNTRATAPCNDTIEVVHEVDRLVYLFTGSTGVTSDQLVDKWANTGAETWSAQRPALAEDLIDMGPDDLAGMLVGR